MKKPWVRILGKVLLFILELAWKLLLTCVWACLRTIELIAHFAGDWVKSLITPNDRRNNDPYRKIP